MIQYREALPSRDEYYRLFLTTGWNDEYHFTPGELSRAIGESWYAVSAWEGKTLCGFGRVIADGVHHALIVDVMVQPDFRGQRIGSEIMRRLIARCRKKRIRDIQLFAASGKGSFYTNLGFTPRPPDAPGMEMR